MRREKNDGQTKQIEIYFTNTCRYMDFAIYSNSQKMDVTNTSVSSFDYASVFFTIGGMIPTLIGLISDPMSEEFGWRGYLQDQLLDKDHMLRNTLLIGFVWGIWHLPLFCYPAQAQYEWFQTSPLLGVGFIVNCVTNALIYNIFYVISKHSVLTILFVHMFENIILTGTMIYPFSVEYLNLVIPSASAKSCEIGWRREYWFCLLLP